MNDFYVYAHYKIGENIPFYIGKGKGNRAWKKVGRSAYWQRTVDIYGLEVKILYENLTEDSAFQKEIELIKKYKHLGLVNLTDGGEGSSGYKFTNDQKAKHKVATTNGAKKRISSPEWYVNTTLASRKKAADPVWRYKIITAARNRSQSIEWRENNLKMVRQLAKDPKWLRKNAEAALKRAKIYNGFVSPTGEIYAPVKNLAQFCKIHGLNNSNMSSVDKEKRNSHKGWTKYRGTVL